LLGRPHRVRRLRYRRLHFRAPSTWVGAIGERCAARRLSCLSIEEHDPAELAGTRGAAEPDAERVRIGFCTLMVLGGRAREPKMRPDEDAMDGPAHELEEPLDDRAVSRADVLRVEDDGQSRKGRQRRLRGEGGRRVAVHEVPELVPEQGQPGIRAQRTPQREAEGQDGSTTQAAAPARRRPVLPDQKDVDARRTDRDPGLLDDGMELRRIQRRHLAGAEADLREPNAALDRDQDEREAEDAQHVRTNNQPVDATREQCEVEQQQCDRGAEQDEPTTSRGRPLGQRPTQFVDKLPVQVERTTPGAQL
jgi:hypothetical protein